MLSICTQSENSTHLYYNVHTIRDFNLLMLFCRQGYDGQKIIGGTLVISSHGIRDLKPLVDAPNIVDLI